MAVSPKNRKLVGTLFEKEVLAVLLLAGIVAWRVKEQAAIRRHHLLYQVDIVAEVGGRQILIQCRRIDNRESRITELYKFVRSGKLVAFKRPRGATMMMTDIGCYVPIQTWIEQQTREEAA